MSNQSTDSTGVTIDTIRVASVGIFGISSTLISIAISATLTIIQDRLATVNGVTIPPHISETAIYAPESQIFAAGFGIACVAFWFSLRALAIRRSWQVERMMSGSLLHHEQVPNACCCGLFSLKTACNLFWWSGFVTCFGLWGLSAISLGVSQIVHLIATFTFFIALCIMMGTDVMLAGVTKDLFNISKFWLQWKRVLFIIEVIVFVGAQIATLSFVITGSVTLDQGKLSGEGAVAYGVVGAVTQYCMIAAAWAYVVSLYSEMRNIKVVQLSI